MKKDARDIIIRPIITENTMNEAQDKKYTFEVDKKANKIMIADAVEEIFDVDVDYVHTMNMKGKVKRQGRDVRRRKNWKKAIVKLTEDSKEIEYFAS